jgi:hypothetical protein
MSLQEDVLAVLPLAQRLAGQVDVDPPGQGEGHDQRRRHEEVGLDALVDARLEVAVAGEDRGGDQVVLRDRLLDRRREGPELPMQVVQP